jgi:hypothetical protein
LLFADTLAGAAEAAMKLGGFPLEGLPSARPSAASAAGPLPKLEDPQRARLVGLFCGGTTGYEALVLLQRAGLKVFSNLHSPGPYRLDGRAFVEGHRLFDLGDDLFTRGKPHPMIEPELRNQRLTKEVQDPAVRLLLFDLVLGHGAHPDPASVLAQGLAQARRVAGARSLLAIASITGTERDPQDYERQRRILEEAGVWVQADNRGAAQAASTLLQGGQS